MGAVAVVLLLPMAKIFAPVVESSPPATARRAASVLLLLLVAWLLTGCNNTPASDRGAPEGKTYVVTTTGIIGDTVSRVGGARVRVESLMGPGVDPHLYKASEGDVRRLTEADVIFFNGLHLEAKMGDVLEQLGRSRRVVAVSSAVAPDRLISSPDYEGSHDPHIWFDVDLWMKVVEKIRDTLVEADPAGAETYRKNAEAELEELAKLDAEVKSRAEAIPAGQRVIITAHDAFNYFGRRYGFEVRGLQGISTASEAGAADVDELARFIAERRIPAIFIESSVPRRNVEAVQEAVTARGFNVRIGGELFSDALGEAGTPAGTYPGMIRHNIETIASALSASDAATTSPGTLP